MICEDPVRIAFYRDLKESLQVSDQGPFGCGCQSCEELYSTIFGDQNQSLELVEMPWESLFGMLSTTNLVQPLVNNIFLFYVRWRRHWLWAGSFSALNVRAFQKEFHWNYLKHSLQDGQRVHCKEIHSKEREEGKSKEGRLARQKQVADVIADVHGCILCVRAGGCYVWTSEVPWNQRWNMIFFKMTIKRNFSHVKLPASPKVVPDWTLFPNDKLSSVPMSQVFDVNATSQKPSWRIIVIKDRFSTFCYSLSLRLKFHIW